MEYVPIRISTLRGETIFEFNIYIQVREKYLLYIRQGDDIDTSRLKRLKKKRVRQLFIETKDEEKYQNFLDVGLDMVINDSSIAADEKADMVGGYASTAVDEMAENPESVVAFKMSEKAASGIVDVLAADGDVLAEIMKKSSESQEGDVGTKHGVNVASLCVALGTAMGLTKQAIRDLGVAGLLHDIGLNELPDDKKHLLTTPYEKFTKEDWKAYKAHPKSGAEVLNGKDYINPQILLLIKVHEERKSGDGFPEKLTKMEPIEEVIALASWYDRLVTCLGWTHKDAFENLKIDQLGNFDMKILDKFKKVLKEKGINNL